MDYKSIVGKMIYPQPYLQIHFYSVRNPTKSSAPVHTTTTHGGSGFKIDDVYQHNNWLFGDTIMAKTMFDGVNYVWFPINSGKFFFDKNRTLPMTAEYKQTTVGDAAKDTAKTVADAASNLMPWWGYLVLVLVAFSYITKVSKR